MNVRDQTSQAFVTSSGPFGDSSCKFLYKPKTVLSTNSGQIKTFQDNSRANVWQFSNRFQSFLFEVMVTKTWCRELLQLLDLLICHFKTSFDAFPRVHFHIIRSSDCFRVKFLPTKYLFSCHHTNFAPQDLQCLTKILATHVVEHVSINLDILTLDPLVILEHRSFSLGCKLILRRLLVLGNLVTLLWHPLLLRPSFEMQTNPVLWMQRKRLNRLWQCYLGAQHGLWILETSVLTPHPWQTSINDAKWTVLCSLCASWMTSLLLITLVIVHAGNFSSFFPFFVHCCFRIEDFVRLEHTNELVHNIFMSQWVEPHLSNVIVVIFR